MICEMRTDKEVLATSVCLYCGNSKLMAQQKVRQFLQPHELFLRDYSFQFIPCQSFPQYQIQQAKFPSRKQS